MIKHTATCKTAFEDPWSGQVQCSVNANKQLNGLRTGMQNCERNQKKRQEVCMWH